MAKIKLKHILAGICMVVGVTLFYTGWKQRSSLGSQIGDILGHAPAEPMWYMAGGAVILLVGLGVLVRGK